MIELSIVIVCYKAKDLIVDCLSGLYEHTTGVEFEVVLCDNSNDGTAELVKQRFAKVRVIDNSKNWGYGAGNNFLCKHAAGKYFLLLNPDTIIRDNAIGELVALARRTPRGGAWGGVTVLADGQIDPGCQQIGPGLFNAVCHATGLGKHRRGGIKPGSNEPAIVPVLSGAFMMFPADLWRELGGFDESFFMYNEEEEICYRVTRMGREVWMTPRARITHLVGSGSVRNPNRMMLMMRSRMHLQWKHHRLPYVLLSALLVWLHGAVRYFGSYVLAPLMGLNKRATIRQAFRDITLKPWQWWSGWPDNATTRDAAQDVTQLGQATREASR
jgi:N-acetylglucosaminyl-diphospho-decaprenol L-rhamnosyltransferase